MHRNVVVRRDYLHYVRKYNRFEKRHKTITAHCSPAFRLKMGDVVTVGQCRPLAKTVRFNVVRQEVQRIEGNVKKAFVLF
jgi:small subunit ribosomal protein S11e